MLKEERVRLDAKVDIKIHEFKWSGNLSQVVRIDGDALTAELIRQPELVSWFGVAAVEAEDDVGRCKNELEVLKDGLDTLYAELDIDIRKAGGAQKPTEAAIKSLILSAERYKTYLGLIADKREELRAALHLSGKISKILIGLDHKRDMLIQLSSNSRHEHQAGDYGHEGPV